ncbi:related to DTD1-D-Tyr-tRNA(Tyr) deacylase activity [Serendipita indica DSM 11827]|uniref:D-aminoacyl-tRNA deacylase n=1 Tax=Serendipita indica (strain DSM 11827) TaxID=1109443 RepID=G4T5V1_SERID|nr:related to DTD1-D-Tyr-tRNA(Tyr) deacylase activity [Serendipita indica DSM 11827]
MRAIIQRVSSASVTVNSEVISSIGEGLMVLVGLGTDDTQDDIETIANKILNLKAFPDPKSGGAWKASVKDRGGEILSVSQFTLFAKIVKNKPDFHKAMAAESSKSMYATFLERMGALYDPSKIKDGQFGAMMSVGIVNEGPVTFTLDSRETVSTPGTSTPTASATSSGSQGKTLAQRNAEKALRRSAWEAGKKSGEPSLPGAQDEIQRGSPEDKE